MMKRRNFLKMGGMASVAAVTMTPKRAHSAVDSSKVYTCYDAGMVSGTTVNYSVVKAAVDSCFKTMTGKSTVADAVRDVFPGVSSSSKIAIKINALNVNISPQFESVKALIECLKTVVTASNISLFDNQLWVTNKCDRAYGASNLDALGIWHGNDTYGSPSNTYGGRTYYISQRLQNSNYGISFAALKPHQYYCGGVSGVIKNMMGACSSSSGSGYGEPNGFHSGGCQSSFSDLFSKYMNNKLHLYFIDMIFGAKHENYSSWTKVVKRIAMGTSPSRVDSYMVQVLKDVGLTDYSPNTSVMAAVGSTSYTRVDVTASSNPLVATPTITPNGGSHVSSVQVTLACSTSGATIRYTTDDSTPTASSPAYSAPFTLNTVGQTTVKARGFLVGYDDSNTASAAFTITEPPKWNRTDAENAVKSHKSSSAATADVQTTVNNYLNEVPK